jgi:ABC-type multidrug transport system fused ATPase/permease subunit
MSMLAMIVTNLQVFFTSLERIKEFEVLPQERPHVAAGDAELENSGWPTHGEITINHASLQYGRTASGQPSGPRVLDDLSLRIEAGHKIGIVGRTGAGKSSLVSVLFRLVEPTGGQIVIDQVDTSSVGLSLLRKNIAIIPQDPILMKGTVGYNLDPFSMYSPAAVLDAMTRAHLDHSLLETSVESGGIGLSVGQRQLICLARALLTRAPIVLMDEPTANCDLETDEVVQAMIRREFAANTVLTIAHRLQTVIDSDMILVLGDGKVLQYGPPRDLLQDTTGAFAAMVAALGEGTSDHLHAKIGLSLDHAGLSTDI